VNKKDGLNFLSLYFKIRTSDKDSLFAQMVIPTTNALPCWRLNVETKTKHTLYSSHRLSFNELMNAKNRAA